MRLSRFIACAVLTIAVFAALGAGTIASEPPKPLGFLEVEAIKGSRKTGKLLFNSGRPYVLSINVKLPDADAARNQLAKQLLARKQLRLFVFEWFGADHDVPTRLNLVIGKNIPVAAAQAVIATFARDSSLPVYIHRKVADGDFGDTQRMYVGALRDRGEKPMTAEQIKALLNLRLNREELMQLIPEDPLSPTK